MSSFRNEVDNAENLRQTHISTGFGNRNVLILGTAAKPKVVPDSLVL